MELMQQPYSDIMIMPYPFFRELLEWKNDLEKEKKNMMEEKTKEIQAKQRTTQAVNMHKAKQLSKRRYQ